jgi:hypothetical protein
LVTPQLSAGPLASKREEST